MNYLAALSLTWVGIYNGAVKKEEVSDIFPPAVCIYVRGFLFLLTKRPFQDHTRSTARQQNDTTLFDQGSSEDGSSRFFRYVDAYLLSTRHRILGHGDLHAT